MASVAELRRQICLKCPKVNTCEPQRAYDFLFLEKPPCPLGKMVSATELRELEARAARAFPAGVDRVSGCCDRADQA